jgi:hypothetical protein
MFCRHWNNKTVLFLDLGSTALANSYLKLEDLQKKEKIYPLKVAICLRCKLVQTIDFVKPTNIFKSDYAYFSSVSQSYLDHAKNYTKKIIKSLNLNRKSFVIEIASNDGYLLKNFKKANINCLGIEPTNNTANAAIKNNIPTIKKFFSYKLSKKLEINNKADLIIANNVYAHIPNINDFTKGIKNLLKDSGTVTIEFQHLLNIIKYCQFDTVYHEHFSYLSLMAVRNIFKKYELKIFKVEKIKTHGGSLRVYGCHNSKKIQIKSSVNNILIEEKKFGINKIKTYKNFNKRVLNIKIKLLTFLEKLKKKQKIVDGYGAAAKGNTLLNFCNIKKNYIRCIYDAAKSKQNKYMPGSQIPIIHPKYIYKQIPDYLLILPWNIKKEIINNFKILRKNKMKFIIPIPKIKIQ